MPGGAHWCWSVGYWASMINYSYQQLGRSYSDRGITDFRRDKSIENDFYGAYSGKLAGDLGYKVGMTAYYYINGKHANAFETKAGLSYGPFSLNAQTLLNDVGWGNTGDTYWTLVYSTVLPYQVTFTSTLGAYTYNRQSKYLGSVDTLTGIACGPHAAFVVNGCYPGNSPSRGGFRHLTLVLSAPIPGTPVTEVDHRGQQPVRRAPGQPLDCITQCGVLSHRRVSEDASNPALSSPFAMRARSAGSLNGRFARRSAYV